MKCKSDAAFFFASSPRPSYRAVVEGSARFIIFCTVAISAPASSISEANVHRQIKEKLISCCYLIRKVYGTRNPQSNGERKMTDSKGTGKLLDIDSGKVECQICKEVWYPPTRPDGWFNEGAFQCPFGCTETELIPNEHYQDTGG